MDPAAVIAVAIGIETLKGIVGGPHVVLAHDVSGRPRDIRSLDKANEVYRTLDVSSQGQVVTETLLERMARQRVLPRPEAVELLTATDDPVDREEAHTIVHAAIIAAVAAVVEATVVVGDMVGTG
jgi:hypothetical protein